MPPTLVSFATAIGNARDVQSPEFKKANSSVVLLRPQYKDGLPEIASLLAIYKTVEQMIDEGKVLAAATPGYGGVAEALFKMCVGNHVGLSLSRMMNLDDLFKPAATAPFLELLDLLPASSWASPPWTTPWKPTAKLDLPTCRNCGKPSWSRCSPTARRPRTYRKQVNCPLTSAVAPAVRLATPRVVIPVFPGTNCEYDTARAFRRAGGEPHILVLKNLTPADVPKLRSPGEGLTQSQI